MKNQYRNHWSQQGPDLLDIDPEVSVFDFEFDIEDILDIIEDPDPDEGWEQIEGAYKLYITEITEGVQGDKQMAKLAEFFDVPMDEDTDLLWRSIQLVAEDLSQDLTALLRTLGYPGDLVFFGEDNQDGKIPGDPYCLWVVVDEDEWQETYGSEAGYGADATEAD